MSAAFLLALAAQAPADIIVTGRALPPLDPPALSTVVLDRRDLDQGASGRLESALAAVAGLQTFRRADSASAHPTTAGLTARGLGGNAASRMPLVVDGVPQADPFGGWVDFPLYSLERIARVTVERGGGQSRWGSGALAGVIEVDSLGPGDGGQVFAAARYGSRDSIDLSGHLLAGGSEAFVMAGASLRRSDGFVPIVADDRGPADIRAPYRQANASLRGAIALSPGIEVQAGLQLVDDRRTRGLADSANRTRGGDASIRLVGTGGTPFQLTFYRQVRRFESQFAAASDDRISSRITLDQYRVPASGWGARGDVDLLTGDIRWRLGADLRTGKGETNERYQFVGGAPTRRREAGGSFAVAGLLTQLSGRSGPWRWSVDGRIDRWSLGDGRFEQRSLAGAVLDDVDFPDRTGWQPSGRASLAHERGIVTIEGAVFRGWRLPTLNELYRPFRVGPDAVAANAALRPEKLVGADFGVRLRPDPSFDLRATAFANRLDDAIANVTLGEGPRVFPGVGFVAGSYAQRLNIDHVTTGGVELASDWHRGPWSATLSASAVRARVKTSGPGLSLTGRRPAQVPAFIASFRASWSPDADRFLSIQARYESARFEDDLNQRRLGGALTVDASAQWPLTRRLALTGAAQNLAGARVESGLSGEVIERAQPRTFWLGLALRR